MLKRLLGFRGEDRQDKPVSQGGLDLSSFVREPLTTESPCTPSPELEATISQIEADINVALGSLDGIRRELDDSIGEHVKLSDHIRAEGDGVATVVTDVETATVSLSKEMKRLAVARDVILSESDKVRTTVDHASQSAEDARRQLDELVQAIASIVGVVHVIDRVSKDTRLLALNASIEARRVGAQGRAFGVIADEVKHLAEDTAKATADITQKIVRLNSSAAASMAAISRMVDVAQELSPSFTAVTSAIDEQGAVIATASTATGQLVASAREAAARADGLREFTSVAVTEAESIKSASSRMSEFMAQFTRRITTAARQNALLGRRREARVTLKRPATLRFMDRIHHCTTIDLSSGGMLVSPRPELNIPTGAKVTVALPDVGSVEARVASVSPKGLHLAFPPNADVTRQVEAIVRASAEANAPLVELAQRGAREVMAVFEAGVANGEIDIDRLFSTRYDPIPRTEPRQFSCDALTFYDKVLPAIVARMNAADDQLRYATVNDRNGYVPVHDVRQSKPQRWGDTIHNERFSRDRRLKLDDDTLEIVRSEAPHLIRRYRRELGDSFEMVKDVSAPIIVRGRHWGAFRTGWEL
ncbi:MAG: methyl-accepting chemotaxis protein [Beijerinckiaceae bacterium]